jgi:hypothetical protein
MEGLWWAFLWHCRGRGQPDDLGAGGRPVDQHEGGAGHGVPPSIRSAQRTRAGVITSRAMRVFNDRGHHRPRRTAQMTCGTM